MAEAQKIEREYIIPLKREWLKVARYERTQKAVKAIKVFIAKHMKVADRDLSKVKLDVYFNNEIWFRGRKTPPTKVKVRAVKEGDIVKVDFVEIPEHVKFEKAKHEKKFKPAEKPKEEKREEQKDEKREEEVKTEKDKEKAAAEMKEGQIKQQAKAEKHLTSKKEESFHRMALKK